MGNESNVGLRFSPRYIINDDYSFIYCVIPKTACSSIKTALVPLFGTKLDTSGFEGASWDKSAPYDVHRLFDKSDYEITKYQLQRRLNEGWYGDYFKFAFVRNPFDRLLSCWRNKLSTVDSEGFLREEYGPVTLRRGMSFSEFVEAVAEIPEEDSNLHWMSQHVSLLDADGELLPDFIGRFENLAQDFQSVAREIGLPTSGSAETKLPHLIKTSSRGKLSWGSLSKRLRGTKENNYRDAFNKRTARLAEERYATDLGLLNYQF